MRSASLSPNFCVQTVITQLNWITPFSYIVNVVFRSNALLSSSASNCSLFPSYSRRFHCLPLSALWISYRILCACLRCRTRVMVFYRWVIHSPKPALLTAIPPNPSCNQLRIPSSLVWPSLMSKLCSRFWLIISNWHEILNTFVKNDDFVAEN